MNRALLNPFDLSELPEKIEDFLEANSRATCMRFNRRGNLLAMGTVAGQVVVWDFETKSVATVLGTGRRHNSAPVTSVSFPAPRSGVTILASYKNGFIRLFDTLAGGVISEVALGMPVLKAEPHPKDPFLAVAVTMDSFPIVLHLRQGVYENPVDNGISLRFPRSPEGPAETAGDFVAAEKARAGQKSLRPPPEIPPAADYLDAEWLCASEEDHDERSKTNYVVRFNRSGDQLLRGGPNGIIRVFVFNSMTGAATCSATKEVPGRAAVRDIVLTRRADRALVVSLDRCLRLFHAESLMHALDARQPLIPQQVEPISMCTDVVNRTQCRTACLSLDGEFVLGGMNGQDHTIHVWRSADGQLERTLEGPRESIGDILWHPLRPVIVSLGVSSGGVYVWEKSVTENWSAFAPDFVELEANEEYVEREDEFDTCDAEDDAAKLAERERVEQGLVLDIETNENINWFTSDSEGEDEFFFVPPDPVTPPPQATIPASRIRDEEPGRRREGNSKKRGRAVGDRRTKGRTRPRVAGSDSNGLPNGNSGATNGRRRGMSGRSATVTPDESPSGSRHGSPDGSADGMTHLNGAPCAANGRIGETKDV